MPGRVCGGPHDGGRSVRTYAQTTLTTLTPAAILNFEPSYRIKITFLASKFHKRDRFCKCTRQPCRKPTRPPLRNSTRAAPFVHSVFLSGLLRSFLGRILALDSPP